MVLIPDNRECCAGVKENESIPDDHGGALCAISHPGSYTGQDAFNDMLPVYRRESEILDTTIDLPVCEGGGGKCFEMP